MRERAIRNYCLLAAGTIATIYALILVGGIVRATGAGMGCPDWPTCFGRWVPPTSESQLPADYQQVYADRGYADTTFNVRKTWTEYLNRLLGVFTGFTILLTLIFSWPLRSLDKQVWHLSLAAFILVGIQGWLGSRVVASNLNPGLITLHMILAQVIVALVIAAIIRSQAARLSAIDIERMPKMIYPLIIVAMVVGLLQLILGTQVREAIDFIAKQSDYVNRHLWIDNLPLIFSIHKYFAAPILVFNIWLIFQMMSHSSSVVLKRLSIFLAVLLVATIVMGMSMDKLNLPVFAQPLHLWLASLILGAQLALLMIMRLARNRTQGIG